MAPRKFLQIRVLYKRLGNSFNLHTCNAIQHGEHRFLRPTLLCSRSSSTFGCARRSKPVFFSGFKTLNARMATETTNGFSLQQSQTTASASARQLSELVAAFPAAPADLTKNAAAVEVGTLDPYQERALAAQDKELYDLLREEKNRQIEGLELIASENFTSQAVMECLGSCLTNKYSEGYAGARYYGGNEVIDKVEVLCQRRALQAFHISPDDWAVNVQPYSGSPANLAVYIGLLQPHDRIMGLDLFSGGHLTHGFYTAKKRVSATSIFFESLPYCVEEKTGLIDYEDLRKKALAFRPKLIICGHSAFPRDINYETFRSVADAAGSILMCDMAHTSGLIAAGLLNSPFEHCDIVTTTTHKTLRGPRGGMIFVNKKRVENGEERINCGVFPALQGGPHDNQIAALACQLKEVNSESWRRYSVQVIRNAQALARRLQELGHRIVTDGTDNHLILVDLRPDLITGAKMQLCCDEARITLNKNTIPGDSAAANPSGVRIGSPALTSRGMQESHFEKIAAWLHDLIAVAQQIQESYGKKIIDFKKGVPGHPRLQEIRSQVVAFSRTFPMPGYLDI